MAKHKPSGPWLSGTFTPLNPQKYVGNIEDIIFRSSYELAAFKFCDSEPAILKWNAEEEIIKYISPKDNKPHRYMMDLKIWTKNVKTGVEQITLVEIKPEIQTRPPRKGNKKQDTYIRECATWSINSAKWEATRQMCKSRGWNFIHWTEEHLVPGIKHDKEIRQKMSERRKDRRAAKTVKAVRSDRVRKLGRVLAQHIRDKT